MPFGTHARGGGGDRGPSGGLPSAFFRALPFRRALTNNQNTNFEGERGCEERWGAGVETQKNVRGEIGGWGRVPFNETYAPSLSTIYDGA